MLKASCPPDMPSSLPDRLDTIQRRIEGLTEAINVLRPAVAGFYASLSDEQKARITTMVPSSTRQQTMAAPEAKRP
jgi:hypothetical protein